jgi:hypothetical protein
VLQEANLQAIVATVADARCLESYVFCQHENSDECVLTSASAVSLQKCLGKHGRHQLEFVAPRSGLYVPTPQGNGVCVPSLWCVVTLNFVNLACTRDGVQSGKISCTHHETCSSTHAGTGLRDHSPVAQSNPSLQYKSTLLSTARQARAGLWLGSNTLVYRLHIASRLQGWFDY